MGLDVYLSYEKDNYIQYDSRKYPEHYFKIGYFRSSYNEWGLNSVLRKTVNKDLYYIFEPKNRYTFKPKWEKSREKCIEVINEFEQFIEKLGNVAVFHISPLMFSSPDHTYPKNEKEVIDIFLQNRDNRRNGTFKNYSNRNGSFYLDGLKCFAFIKGKDYCEKDCVYIVYEPNFVDKKENEDTNVYKNYTKALEIVLETIDYVLESGPERKKYTLHWSP